MWYVAVIEHGYPDIPVVGRDVFRMFLGLSLVWKFSWDLRWGGLHYFSARSFVRWRHERSRIHLKLIPSPRAYQVFYLLRYLCGWFVLLGILSSVASVIVVLWCAFEFTYDRKFHTQFLLLSSLLMALTPGDQCMAAFSSGAQACTAGMTWSAPVIVFCFAVVVMYAGSVWIKGRSPQFMSGEVLQRTYGHFAKISSQMRFSETVYPRWALRALVWTTPASARRRWAVLARSALVLEAAMPPLLLIPGTWPVAVVTGAVLHAAFWALFPRRLLPFSLCVVGSYVLFADPGVVQLVAAQAIR